MKVNNKPFPWFKAFGAGVSAALPVLIGLLLGNFQYGLIAGLGGFAYLYVFEIPYRQRAKKIFWVVIGLTSATFLGTLVAPYPMIVSILMGIIGAVTVFIFGALKIAGPSDIFFVLVFAMSTGMPIQPEEALLRAGLVFVGGCLAWVISMIGWFIHPHGPEAGVVARVYYRLADFFDAVGTEKYHQYKHNVMEILQESEETLWAGYIRWRITDNFTCLYKLNHFANELFLLIVKNFSNYHTRLPKEIGESLRNFAKTIEKGKQENIISPEFMDSRVKELSVILLNAKKIFVDESKLDIKYFNQFDKPTLRRILWGAFDKNSIVFISSLRFGIVTMVAALISYQFDLVRPYWVPLSCVAVMSGSTIIATFHRTIQRFFGTVIGIGIAAVILSFQPSGIIIIMFVFLLTFLTELFIVKNYGLAALFFTPNALLMAESTSNFSIDFTYFAGARIIDIVIGSAIGLFGVFLLGRKSASSRVPHLLSKTLRSQSQFFIVLFSDQGAGLVDRKRIKMRTNLNNLQTLYHTASGEIPRDQEALDYYWPIIYATRHLGYLLELVAKQSNRPILSDEKLAQFLFVFESMALAATRKGTPNPKDIPEISGYPSLQKAIRDLLKEFSRDQSTVLT